MAAAIVLNLCVSTLFVGLWAVATRRMYRFVGRTPRVEVVRVADRRMPAA